MSELPRLLLCSFDVIPAPSGSSRRITEYLRGLSDHFNVVVLSAKTPDHSHIEKFQGARLLRVPVGSGDLVSRLQSFDRAVRRQLESEEYAVVHFTDPFGGYALCELREQYGYKLVYEAQSFPSQEIRFTHPQLEGDRKFLAKVRRQELFCLMNADRVITGSTVTREMIHSLGVSPANVELLRAPVDLEPYTEEAMGPPDASPMRVVYLGSQVGWQGLPSLLRGMQHALRDVDLRLVIVGPSHPAWQPLLEDLVEELKLGGKVEFQPPVAHGDLHKVLALADVGVAPLDDLDRNREQGGALAKAAEYLAAGRPVIASDLPIAREVLTEDVALFHEPGDPEDIGDCLVTLGKSAKRRVKMGKAAFALARKNHDAAVIRERVRQIYMEITGLAPVARRGEEEEAGGPAPTLIGAPLSPPEASLPARSKSAASKDREGGTDPAIAAGGGASASSDKKKDGTDPAISPGGSSKRGSSKSSADKRRDRRKKRREVTEELPAATDPALAKNDAPRVVMGTPVRDDSPGTDPGARPGAPEYKDESAREQIDQRSTEPRASASSEPRVVMGTPVRDAVESGRTEPGASSSSEPRVVMGTPLRDAVESGRTEPGASSSSEPRVVMGTPLREESRRDGGTEPGASVSSEPRVVMGTPLREDDAAPRSSDAVETGRTEPGASASSEPRVVMGTPIRDEADDFEIPKPNATAAAERRTEPRSSAEVRAAREALRDGAEEKPGPPVPDPEDAPSRRSSLRAKPDRSQPAAETSTADGGAAARSRPIDDPPTPKSTPAVAPEAPTAASARPIDDPPTPKSTPAVVVPNGPIAVGTPLETLPQPPGSAKPAAPSSVIFATGTPLEQVPQPKPTGASVVFAVGTPLEQVPQPKPAGASVVFAVGTPLEAVPQPKLPSEAVSKPLVSGTPLESIPQPKLPARVPSPAVVVTTTSRVSVNAPSPSPAPSAGPSVLIDPELLGTAKPAASSARAGSGAYPTRPTPPSSPPPVLFPPGASAGSASPRSASTTGSSAATSVPTAATASAAASPASSASTSVPAATTASAAASPASSASTSIPPAASVSAAGASATSPSTSAATASAGGASASSPSTSAASANAARASPSSPSTSVPAAAAASVSAGGASASSPSTSAATSSAAGAPPSSPASAGSASATSETVADSAAAAASPTPASGASPDGGAASSATGSASPGSGASSQPASSASDSAAASSASGPASSAATPSVASSPAFSETASPSASSGTSSSVTSASPTAASSPARAPAPSSAAITSSPSIADAVARAIGASRRASSAATDPDGPEEVDPDEVQSADPDDDGPREISEDEVVEAPSTLNASAPPAAAEVESADDAVVGPVDDPEPAARDAHSDPTLHPHDPEVASRLDAWFAQLTHGYCPPEGAQFARPTPPTNFPGREGPPPATVQPGAPAPQSIPTRSGGG